MNITERLQAIKERYRSTKNNNYDHLSPHYQSRHSQRVTIGSLKAERLRIKNMRRAENSLPPKATYAEI